MNIHILRRTHRKGFKYEYGPFGEVFCSVGDMAKVNPFGFSTKYTDPETDLLYYGYRYYSPALGRWLSRDPIEEQGGLNLYGFVNNDPANKWDRLGLQSSLLPIPSSPPLISFPGTQPTPLLVRPVGPHPVLACATIVLAGWKVGDAIGEHTGIHDAIGQAIVDCLEKIKDKCDRRKCRPCIPAVGSIGYRIDYPPSRPHNGIPTPHSHRYVVHQSPPKFGCICFWHLDEKHPRPGVWMPERTKGPPAGGGIMT